MRHFGVGGSEYEVEVLLTVVVLLIVVGIVVNEVATEVMETVWVRIGAGLAC